jgi:hypothetical protein
VDPEILLVGSSRVAQWRADFFKPYSFYNASNSSLTIEHIYKFLTGLNNKNLKIVIFSLDPFMLHPIWKLAYKNVSLAESPITLESTKYLSGQVIESILMNPKAILGREPFEGKSSLGSLAILHGEGWRRDGSLRYGEFLDKMANGIEWYDSQRRQSDLNRIKTGAGPFHHGEIIDPEAIRDLKKLSEYASEKGIQLVGITHPFSSELNSAIENSAKYGYWKQFFSSKFQVTLDDLGIIYFDFSDPLLGNILKEEFVDGFHVSETGVAKIAIQLLNDQRIKRLLPKAQPEKISKLLKYASYLEVVPDR